MREGEIWKCQPTSSEGIRCGIILRWHELRHELMMLKEAMKGIDDGEVILSIFWKGTIEGTNINCKVTLVRECVIDSIKALLNA